MFWTAVGAEAADAGSTAGAGAGAGSDGVATNGDVGDVGSLLAVLAVDIPGSLLSPEALVVAAEAASGIRRALLAARNLEGPAERGDTRASTEASKSGGGRRSKREEEA